MLEEEGVPRRIRKMSFELPVIKHAGNQEVESPRRPGMSISSARERSRNSKGLLPVSRLSLSTGITKIQAQQSKGAGSQAEEIASGDHKFTPLHTAFFNLDEIWFALENYKAERSWYNLNLSRNAISRTAPTRPTGISPLHPCKGVGVQHLRQGTAAWQENRDSRFWKKYVERLYLYRKAEFEHDAIPNIEKSPTTIPTSSRTKHSIWWIKRRTRSSPN